MTKILSILKAAGTAWWNDNALRLAASLSFYTALSIAPLLIIVVAVAGVVFGRQAVSGQLATQMGDLMGQDGRQIVETVLAHASQEHQSVIAAIVGVITLIISATAVFGELQSVMNLIWDIEAPPRPTFVKGLRSVLRQRLLSLTMVLVIAFLLLVSLVISAALSVLAGNLHGGVQTRALVGQIIDQLVSIPVLTLLFAMIFKLVPDVAIHWRDVWIGALVSALLFTLGKYAIGLYLGHASVGSAYGAAGSLMVLLMWVYYSSLIFIFGAEFTQAYANRHGGPPPAKTFPSPK